MELLFDDIVFLQRFLKSAGFYTGTIDGDFGPITNAAEAEFMKESDALAAKIGTFDPRTEGRIKTLLPAAQEKARKFMVAVLEAKIPARIISGTRTYAEQHAIFMQRPRVTHADAGRSNHNFGIAWDIGIFPKGQYLAESPIYAEAGKIGKGLGLFWGGDWRSIRDEPHFQLLDDDQLAVVRVKFESGASFV